MTPFQRFIRLAAPSGFGMVAGLCLAAIVDGSARPIVIALPLLAIATWCTLRVRGTFNIPMLPGLLAIQVDAQSTVLDVNEEIQKRLGLPRWAVRRTALWNNLIAGPPPSAPGLEALRLALAEPREFRADRTGKIAVVQWEVVSGSRGKVWLLGLDITERALAARRDASVVERFELALRGTDAAVWDWDLRTNLVYFSPRWKSMLGYAEDEIPDRFAEWERLIHPEDHRKALAALDSYLTGKSRSYAIEIRMRHKDGMYVWILSRGECLRDESGRPYRMAGSHQDITRAKLSERRLGEFAENLTKSEASLREQTALLQAILNGLMEGVVLANVEGKIQLWNPAAEWLFGTALLGRKQDLAILEGSVFPSAKSPLSQTKSTREGQEIETFLRNPLHPDGYWLAMRTYSVFDPSGARRGSVVVARDVTQRRLAEDSLREREYQMRQVLAGMPVVLFALDRNGIFTLSEGSGLNALGLVPGQVVGQSALKLYEGSPQLVADIHRALAGESFVSEAEVNGRLFDTRFNAVRNESGAVAGMIGVALDATDRRRAEQAIRESEARKAAILEAALDCIITINHEGRVLEFNPAAEKTFGISRTDILGKVMSDLIVPPHHREGHRQGMAHYMRTGEGPVLGKRIEIDAMRIDGTIFPVELALTVVCQDGPPQFTAYLRDITERRQSRADLQHAKELAEAANRAKGEFLANMSHEVRTPMTAILGYADMILDPLTTEADRSRALHAIRQNGRHLLNLINDILDISKLESGKLILERVPVSPWSLVQEVLSILRVSAKDKSVELEAGLIGPLPPPLLLEPTRTRQVLMNLVSNAIKFTEHGRVRVTVSLDSAAGQDRISFRVEDEGIGMTEEQLARLFVPFQQADASVTRRYGGTGLGLSISHRLAEAMGGTIEVVSTPEKGSCFTLRLPAELAVGWTDAPIAPADLPVPTMRFQGRVLLAEDGKDNQRILAYYLASAGLEVEIADDGRIAVDMALHSRYDIILMDMQMPELDGYGATSTLRQQGYTGPIIAITAHALTGDRDKCLRAGCSGYLAKPVERESLLRTIAQYLPTQKNGPSTNPTDTLTSLFASDLKFMELVRDYVGGLPDRLDEMDAALSAGDREKFRRLAHQSKGASGMYGFPDLSETFSLMEEASVDDQPLTMLAEFLAEAKTLAARARAGISN